MDVCMCGIDTYTEVDIGTTIMREISVCVPTTMSVLFMLCTHAHAHADTHTHTHTHTHRGMGLNHQKGMKSHSLQELGETFRGYYAK